MNRYFPNLIEKYTFYHYNLPNVYLVLLTAKVRILKCVLLIITQECIFSLYNPYTNELGRVVCSKSLMLSILLRI